MKNEELLQIKQLVDAIRNASDHVLQGMNELDEKVKQLLSSPIASSETIEKSESLKDKIQEGIQHQKHKAEQLGENVLGKLKEGSEKIVDMLSKAQQKLHHDDKNQPPPAPSSV